MKKICDVTKAEKERFLPAEIQVVWLNHEDIVTLSTTLHNDLGLGLYEEFEEAEEE